MNDEKATETSFANRWAPLLLIMGAVAAWGIYHVVGAIRSGEDLATGLIKGLIIFGTLTFFLGLWGLALLSRARQERRSRDSSA